MSGEVVANPHRVDVLDSNRLNFPRAFHVRLPGYAPTPLLELSELALELGVRRLWLKDESRRFQMHSYELLGTAWALYREVLGRLGRRVRWDTIEELVAAIQPIGELRIVVVSDNEFGVATARAARLLGFPAVVYVPGEMSAERMEAVVGEGAELVAVPGGYDAALAAAALETGDRTVIVSDSSWEGFDEMPGWVTEGYATIFEEAVDEIDRRHELPIDAVFVPLGTGALAAAAGAYFRVERFGSTLQLVGVEPVAAPCFAASARAGRRTAMPEPGLSTMASLARGLPSPLAWDVVSFTFDAFVCVDDACAADTERRLARHAVTVSPAGAAALAGLLEVLRPDRRGGGTATIPAIGPDSAVLVVATEAPRDPVAAPS